MLREPRRITRTQRIVTIGFLVLFVGFGLSGAEWWPMTSWHLFSGIRTRHVEVWQATAINAEGRETAVPFRSFGVRYAGWYSRLLSFERLPAERQLAECSAWADEMRARSGMEVRAIVVYRGDEDRGARVGDRAAPPTWSPAFRCEDGRLEVTP